MKKSILGVLGGYLAWSVLWLALNAVLALLMSDTVTEFEETGYLGDALYLGALLVCSMACSLAAGRLCAKLGPAPLGSALWVMAGLLLLTGVAVQASSWASMPVWYHLIFLALIVPVCAVGARSRPAV